MAQDETHAGGDRRRDGKGQDRVPPVAVSTSVEVDHHQRQQQNQTQHLEQVPGEVQNALEPLKSVLHP